MEVEVDGWKVLMDDADYEREFCNGCTWRVVKPTAKPYLIRRTREKGTKKTIRFHRLVIGASPEQMVDHINGNSLDNRRSNLRIATAAENSRNALPRHGYSSRFKGVGWHKGAWRARIRVNHRHICVGRFSDEVEAAFAYDIASLKYHGEYGCRNFLPLA